MQLMLHCDSIAVLGTGTGKNGQSSCVELQTCEIKSCPVA